MIETFKVVLKVFRDKKIYLETKRYTDKKI